MILEKVRTDVNAEADTIGRNSAANVLVGLSQNSNRNRSRNRNRVNNTRKTNSRQRYNRNYNANTESAFPVNYFNVTRVSQRKRK